MASSTPQQNDTLHDHSFLQKWLEKRYGSGFAQVVMDDLGAVRSHDFLPYAPSPMAVANDNTTMWHDPAFTKAS